MQKLGDFKFECPKIGEGFGQEETLQNQRKKGLTSSWED